MGPTKKHHSDKEYMEAVKNHQPASTKEIADTVGVARQSAGYRLKKLEDKGKIESKKIGNSLAWMFKQKIKINKINPNDDFWDADTYKGEEMSASNIDDVIYKY